MADAFVKLLGDELKSAGTTVKTAEALKDKVVGLYFSAHWCGPCRHFTPELAKSYSEHLQAKGFEIIFVSSDRDEKAFDEYYASMPWKALPFSERDAKQALSKKFKVQGIPTLVILDKDGTLITDDARSNIDDDPKGEDFPWKPKPFHQVLGTSFVGQDGKALDESAVEGKVLGLYFSAHWCPPCRGFTPKLAEWYKKVKPNLPDFEIIFLSSDRTKDAFKEYFAEMPWIAVPYEKRKEKEALSNLFGVEGIPSFVIVDKDGTTISTKGRSIPAMDPEGKQFPWHPKALQDMATGVDGINDTPSVLALIEGADEATQEAIKAAMAPVAEECKKKAKETGEGEVLFFYGGPSAQGIASKIRGLTNQTVIGKHAHPLKEIPDRENWSCDGCSQGGEGTAYSCAECNFDYCKECNDKAVDAPVTCLIMDISEGGYYPAEGVDFTKAESIREFVSKYQAGSLTKKALEE